MIRHLIAAAALATTASPAVVLAQTRAISQSEKQLGAQAHPQLLQQYGGPYAGSQAALVERVGKRIATQSGLSNASSDFTVTLLDSKVPNAFAIPGGYVYVTRQLLALMNTEAELASVMGHEVGHVAARHAAKRNSRATIGSLLAAGVGIATGSDLARRGAGAASQLYALGYSRSQEYEADGLGVRYLAGAAYNPFAAADMLAALDAETQLQANVTGKQSNLPSWMSTHPNGADRVRRAEQLAQQTGRPQPAFVQDTAFLRSLNGLKYDDDKRISIVTVKQGDTVESLAQRMAYADAQVDRFCVLNGVSPEDPLTPGSLVKIVTTG